MLRPPFEPPYQPLEPGLLRNRLSVPDHPVEVVLDTDTYNEIDDQFALVYAMLLKDGFDLAAVYAAPFHNHRSKGPENGMELSYAEILNVLEKMEGAPPPVFRGSTRWLEGIGDDLASEARDDLIERALARSPEDPPLYVAAIGAITNIAAAVAAAPEIRDRIAVLWLAGNGLSWWTANEFNLQGDPTASRLLLDSGTPVVLFPCRPVCESLSTTAAEMEAFVRGHGRVGDYLYKIFMDYDEGRHYNPGTSKVIWDLAPLGWLACPHAYRSTIDASPIVTEDLRWAWDGNRHPVRIIEHVKRDPVFQLFFCLLSEIPADLCLREIEERTTRVKAELK